MKIAISVETLKQWRELLDPYMFGGDSEDEWNNEGVLAVIEDLDDLLHQAWIKVRDGLNDNN